MTQELPEKIKKPLTEFSLYIDKAGFDKESGEMRFHAVGSDTLIDSYGDNMTAELFSDFLERIESKEAPPEGYGNDFWNGGIPYLSVSHYPDMNGKAVPGDIAEIYMDGNRLKGKGVFNETPLGIAAFKSVCKDQTGEVEEDRKVRISIAFLDWKHRHKSNGYTFERKSITDRCPECIKEFTNQSGEGKEYLRGHLVHWALTRVPVNQRTDVELEEKSMSEILTRKDDAASIVGEEEAEKIDEMQFEAKSEAVVIKSEEAVVEEAKAKKEEDDMEDDDMEDDEEEKKKMKDEEKSEVSDDRLDKILSLLSTEEDELDKAYKQFRSEMQSAKSLEELQPAFEQFGNVIRSMYETEETQDVVQSDTRIDAVMEKLSLLTEKVDALSKARTAEPVAQAVPERRSVVLDPNVVLSQPKKPLTIKEIAHRSVYGS